MSGPQDLQSLLSNIRGLSLRPPTANNTLPEGTSVFDRDGNSVDSLGEPTQTGRPVLGGGLGGINNMTEMVSQAPQRPRFGGMGGMGGFSQQPRRSFGGYGGGYGMRNPMMGMGLGGMFGGGGS